ncbi:MAG: hypothetical protein D6785_10055, partial [Planctomycetota bacterium]
YGYSYYSENNNLFWVPPAEMPSTWISYSGIRMVILKNSTFLTLPHNKQQALIHYAVSGGKLCLLDSSWEDKKREAVLSLFPPSYSLPSRNEQNRYFYKVAQGELVFFHTKEIMVKEVMDFLWHYSRKKNNIILSFHKPSFHSLDEGPQTTSGVILLIFSLLFIPWLWWNLKKKGELIQIYFLLPLSSFLVSLFLFLLPFITEGVNAKGEIYRLYYLDQDKKNLYSKEIFQLYFPLGASKLDFLPDTAVFWNHVIEEGFYSKSREDSNLDLSLNWNKNQTFFGDWVQPRVSSFGYKSGVHTYRGRILLKRKKEKLWVTNSLGWNLKEFYYYDEEGKLYYLDYLKDGESKQLASVGKKLPFFRFLSLSPKFYETFIHPKPQNFFLAVGENVRDFEPALGQIYWSKEKNVIVGTLKPGE